jgi:Ca2+-binding EF-hand superfamily protein
MNKLLILAFTIAFSSLATANETVVVDAMKTAETDMSFESIDVDSDGVISMEEVSEHEVLQLAFEELDANKDGSISEDEYQKLSEITQ